MLFHHGKRKNLRKFQAVNSVCFAEVLERRLLMANGFTVSTLADTGAGSLRTAITNANAAVGTDIITFTNGLSGTINLGSALPAITSNTTIDGSGANVVTVNGQGHGSVFTINSGVTAEIENLTITGGNASAEGGGIESHGNLTVANSTISGNTAGSFGGGIYSGVGATALTVIDSTISGNSVGGNGGGILFNYGKLAVTNSTITGNSAGQAGGFYGRGTLSFIDSTISGNSAGATGGLLIIDGGTGSSTVDGTIIAANAEGDFADKSATAATGASDLIGDGSDGGVFTSSLRGTTANPLNPLLGALTNNGGPTQTLALLPGSPALNTGASFNGITTDQRGDARPSGSGFDIGAFEVQVLTVNTLTDPATPVNGLLSLREAIAQSNALGATQSINFITGLSGTINLASALPVFTSNITINGPGAKSLTVNGQGHGSVFTINSGVTSVIENVTVTGGANTFYGGGIEDHGNLTVTNSTISGNTTNGVSFLDGGGINDDIGASLTVIDSTISGNSSGEDGGGIGFIYSTLVVINSTTTGNSAANLGGSIYGLGALSVTDSTISGNSGGVYVSGGSCVVDGTIVAGNAGGDFSDSSTTPATGSNDLIGDGSDNGVFTNSLRGTTANPLNPMLGALINNGGPTPTMALLTGSPALNTGASFSGITTDQRGASRPSNTGIDIGAFQVQFLTVNSLIDPATPPNGTVTLRLAITEANFSGFAETINFANGLAGTIALDSPLSAFTSNITIDGPGASVLTVNAHNNGGGSVFTINAGVTSVIENLTITGGNSSGDGGGILNTGSLTVANSTISQNTSAIFGGGIYSALGSALTVMDSTVSGNFCSQLGGGIKFNYAAVAITNSTITGNSAAFGGAGVYGRGALTCTDCTISGNSSDYGSGLYISNGSCTVDGTIIAGNAGGDFEDISPTPASGSNDLIGDGSDNGVLANSLRGSKANPLNPALSPLGNYGGPTPTLALQAGSPALNTGANFNNLNTDQRGFVRPTTSGIDMGADQGALFAGDTNFDGTVNLTDLLTLLNNYGETGKGWTQGDFNFDGTVNLTDLLALLNNYGESANDTSIATPAVAAVSYKAKNTPFASEPLQFNSSGSLLEQISGTDDPDGRILGGSDPDVLL